MKLKDKDIDDLMHADEEETFVPGKEKDATRDIEITSVSNRVLRLRNAVNEKNEDNRIYGNRDKSRR